MAENKGQETISEEEYSRINAFLQTLPLKTYSAGGTEVLVRTDSTTGVGYIMKPDGSWSGKKINAKKKMRIDHPVQEPISQTDTVADPSPNTKKKNTKALIFVGAVTVVIIVLFVIFVVGNISPSDTVASPPEQSQPAAPDADDLAVQEHYTALCVKKNIYAGEKITEDDLAYVTLTKDQFAVCGGVYTDKCAGAVIGMYAKEFMLFGTLIKIDSVTEFPTVTKSPWDSITDGYTYYDIRLDNGTAILTDILPGNKVNMSLKFETTKQERGSGEGIEIEGMTHKSSLSETVTIHTFDFSSIIVADLLDKDGNSIYPHYLRLNSSPYGFLPTIISEDYAGDNTSLITPSYVRIIVSNDQSKELKNFSAYTASVEIDVLSYAESPDYPHYYSRMKVVQNLLEQQIEINNAANAEED